MNATHSFDIPINVSITVSGEFDITDFLFPNKGKIDGAIYMVVCVTLASSYENAVIHGHIAQHLRDRHYGLVGWKNASNAVRQAIKEGVATYQQKVADNVESFRLCMYGDNEIDGWFTTFGWDETTDGECELTRVNPARLFNKKQFILITLPRDD